jgi:hypothetical protein
MDRRMHQKNEKPTQLDKPSQAESDAQRAKKRAWDRAAQRTLRQKTRVRIEHLEKTVQALEEERHGTVIPKLMDEIEALRTENERLGKSSATPSPFCSRARKLKRGQVLSLPARFPLVLLPTSPPRVVAYPAEMGPGNHRRERIRWR